MVWVLSITAEVRANSRTPETSSFYIQPLSRSQFRASGCDDCAPLDLKGVGVYPLVKPFFRTVIFLWVPRKTFLPFIPFFIIFHSTGVMFCLPQRDLDQLFSYPSFFSYPSYFNYYRWIVKFSGSSVITSFIFLSLKSPYSNLGSLNWVVARTSGPSLPSFTPPSLGSAWIDLPKVSTWFVYVGENAKFIARSSSINEPLRLEL